MFLKFRVNAAIAKFITTNRLHAETLKFFESGPLDAFMPAVEVAGFDANQGAVAVITGTISESAKNGALTTLKTHAPLVYTDLVVLWKYCGDLCAADARRFGNAGLVGSIESNPFVHAERNSYIPNAIGNCGNEQPKAKSSGGKISTKTFRCTECGAKQSVSTYDSVRASDGDLKRKLLGRELFGYRCTECKIEIQLIQSLLYHDTEKELAIWLCNGGATEELEEAMDEFSALMPNSYTLRVAYNIDELIEKIHIFDSGLNDLLVHLIKIGSSDRCQSSSGSMRFANMERKRDGTLSITFNLADQGRSLTLQDINDPTPTVRLWSMLEEDLDWVHVSDSTFMPIFKMFRDRFPDR